jgi:hypothetical protein
LSDSAQARVVATCLVCLALLGPAGTAVHAQSPGPPGPYVIDVHAGVSALPKDVTYFPEAPSGTLVAGSGLAIDAGGHVYLIRLGPARLGVGASVWRASGRTSEQSSSSTSGTAATVVRPGVDTRVTSVTAQLSLNFGSADGWSYISAGLGPAQVRTVISAFPAVLDGEPITLADRVFEPDSVRDANIGFGARWFTRRHLAISFDVRFHAISGGSGDAAVTRTTLTVASAGFSFR